VLNEDGYPSSTTGYEITVAMAIWRSSKSTSAEMIVGLKSIGCYLPRQVAEYGPYAFSDRWVAPVQLANAGSSRPFRRLKGGFNNIHVGCPFRSNTNKRSKTAG